MIEVYRWYHDDCTIGRLTRGDFQCWTLELPWLNNKQDQSCITEGTYEYFSRRSPTKGRVLQLRDVMNRSYIQVHSGNFTYQILGCMLVGDGIKWLNSDGIPDVTNSKTTLKSLLSIAGSQGHIIVK